MLNISKLYTPLAAGATVVATAAAYSHSHPVAPQLLTARHASVRAPSATLSTTRDNLAVAAPFGNPAHGWDYYQKSLIGGILSCGLTHMAMVPFDVVKCRTQTMPELYKSTGQGLSIAFKEGALLLGWLPTLLGYSAQGMFKYGLYEVFKMGVQ